jgi:Ran GTPase-activating protein (RanGAP) involved in mRNA processing and transport
VECKGVGSALTSLKSYTDLSSLNFNENHLGKEGAIAFASCLHFWPNLQELSLAGTT